MLKKTGWVLTLILAAGLTYLGASKLLDKVPVFLPAFTPVKEDIRERLPQALGELKVFADLGSNMPRALTFDPNGVLVTSIPNGGKILALPDGKPVEILSGLNKPHGIEFEGDKLFVAETDGVSGYDYDAQTMRASNKESLFNLPGGGGHSTRTIKIRDGRIYVTTGSSCNVCEEQDQLRAALWVADLDGGNLRQIARGLRNTVFFTFDEEGRIWGNDMGRDLLGDNLPPDELNIIATTESTLADYGWPWCYGNQVRDGKYLGGQKLDYCRQTVAPAYEYPAHVAPLGITFDPNGDLLVSFHGSWNSTVPVGYKVVRLRMDKGSVVAMEDFISGWIEGNTVLGRPVDLIFDKEGNLYISDDKSGLIYISPKVSMN